MRIYTVTVRSTQDSTEPAIFSGPMFHDVEASFEDYDRDGNEIYELASPHDLDRVLDLTDAVIDYSVERLVRITNLALTTADRKLKAAGFKPASDVTEVIEEAETYYTTFEAWLTDEQIQILKEQNDTEFHIVE